MHLRGLSHAHRPAQLEAHVRNSEKQPHKRHDCFRSWLVKVFSLMYWIIKAGITAYYNIDMYNTQLPLIIRDAGVYQQEWHIIPLDSTRWIPFLYKRTSNSCSNGTCWIRKGEALPVYSVLISTVRKKTKEQKGRFGNLRYLKSIYIHLFSYTISYSMYVYSELQSVFKAVFFVRFECVNTYIYIDKYWCTCTIS